MLERDQKLKIILTQILRCQKEIDKLDILLANEKGSIHVFFDEIQRELFILLQIYKKELDDGQAN
jgi:hypothetical protein